MTWPLKSGSQSFQVAIVNHELYITSERVPNYVLNYKSVSDLVFYFSYEWTRRNVLNFASDNKFEIYLKDRRLRTTD